MGSSPLSATRCKTSRTTMRPRKKEIVNRLTGEAFAGEFEPMTVALVPLRNLGTVHASVSDLAGDGSTIPASAIDLGYVSYRLSRVTSEGTVYTIAPRLIMPGGDVEMPQGLTRRFWMTVKTPAAARPGLYKGTLSIRAREGDTSQHTDRISGAVGEAARRWTFLLVRSGTRREYPGSARKPRRRRSISRW